MTDTAASAADLHEVVCDFCDEKTLNGGPVEGGRFLVKGIRNVHICADCVFICVKIIKLHFPPPKEK